MDEIHNKLFEVERFFSSTKYDSLVKEANDLFFKGDYNKLEESLKKFPSRKDLLAELTETLKGKSVFDTLKKIVEGKIVNDYQALKGLSSLYTHACIECEKGNREYRLLLVDLYERIGALMYKT
jgi:hypothetical protein